MQVSKEELLHIANLAQLELNDDEIDKYLLNLQEILNFAEIVNNAKVDDLDVTIGANEAKNVFRKGSRQNPSTSCFPSEERLHQGCCQGPQ